MLQLAGRAALTFVATVATLYFAFWLSGALLLGLGAPPWLSTPIAILLAFLVSRFVWLTPVEGAPSSLFRSVVMGAVMTGSIAFMVGFFGPMILMPDANQGPMLGLLITGPLGFVLGGVGGALYWMRQRARAVRSHAGPSTPTHS